MKFAVLIALLAVVATSVAIETEGDVLVPEADEFDSVLEDNELVMVKFYAPWCGHCKRLAPEYDAAAEKLADNVPLVKVDCTDADMKDLCSEYGVRGYPTVKVFRDGKPTDYPGPRTSDGIVSYLKRQSGPAVKPIATVEEAEALIADEEVVVFGFFSDADSREYKAFAATAKSLRDDYSFAEAVGVDEIAAKYDVTPNKVVLFKQFDEGRADYEGKMRERDLKEFITEEATPLLAQIGPDNHRKFMDLGLPLFWLFIDPKDTEATDAGKEVVTKVAAEFKGDVSFVWLDGKKHMGHAKNLGASGEQFPAIVLQNLESDSKFVFGDETEQTAENIEQFVNDALEGKLEPHVRSAEAPEENDGPVKVLVRSEYEELITDDKDALIEFYAPWCGHCKKLAPIYEELGEAVKDVETLVIAKCDATANDPPAGYKVSGYPTIYFKPAGKKPIKYTGGRTVDDFVSYLKSKATHPVEIGEAAGHDEL